MIRVRLADDALAIACGADAVAAAFAAAGCLVERCSSWGLHWLEPLAEIDGHGFGPLTPAERRKLRALLAHMEKFGLKIDDEDFTQGEGI